MKKKEGVPLSENIKFSKSSKNLLLTSDISNSIRKIYQDIQTKPDQISVPKAKKSHEFFKKKYTHHKRGIHSDFGIESKRLGLMGMKESSLREPQPFDVNLRSKKNIQKLLKLNAELRLNRNQLKRPWNEPNLRAKQKAQKWEKGRFQRLPGFQSTQKDSMDDTFPPQKVVGLQE